MEMDEVENPEESAENRSTKEIKIHELDDLLKITGGFGRYQMVLYAFMCLVSIPTGAQLLIQVFYGASPPFVCVSRRREMKHVPLVAVQVAMSMNSVAFLPALSLK